MFQCCSNKLFFLKVPPLTCTFKALFTLAITHDLIWESNAILFKIKLQNFWKLNEIFFTAFLSHISYTNDIEAAIWGFKRIESSNLMCKCIYRCAVVPLSMPLLFKMFTAELLHRDIKIFTSRQTQMYQNNKKRGQIVCKVQKCSTFGNDLAYAKKTMALLSYDGILSEKKPPSLNWFVYYYKFNKTKWKKRRWCAWDLNPGPQDGRCRWNHRAMAAAQPTSF